MSSSGSFWSATYTSFCSQLAASACCASCSNQGPYHRHCGCSLHAGSRRLIDGSSSPKRKVKVSNKSRSGMFRSMSVQNLGEKGLSTSCSSSSLSDMQSPFDESSFDCEEGLADEESSLSTDGGSKHMLELIEDLATLIQQMKEGGMTSESMCSDDDDEDVSLAAEQKQLMAYRSHANRSVANLCEYTGADKRNSIVAAAQLAASTASSPSGGFVATP